MTKTKDKHSRTSSRQGISARSHSWILVLIIILIIVAVITVVIFVTKPHSDTTSNPSQPDVPTSDETSNPSSETPPESSSGQESPDNKAPQYEGEDPNDLNELTGVITYKGVENNTLVIMTVLNQYLHQTGICVVTLTGRTQHNIYTASVDAHGDATTSYCEDFDVPISNLASDTYDIEIKLTGDGKTGTIHDEVTL